MIKKNKEKIFYIQSAGVFLIVVILGLAFFYFGQQRNKKNETEFNNQVENVLREETELPEIKCEYRVRVDGTCLENEDDSYVYAVMIDNHYDARPPSSLSNARLVYEAIVESPITRFLAIFSSLDELLEIGPVRSARPFYVDWMKEFNGPYLHVGGSNAALETLKSYSYDLNEFSNGGYFWRDYNKIQPHYIYTSSENVNLAIKKKDWSLGANFSSWNYKDDLPDEFRPDEHEVIVDFATPAFTINWKYNKELNDYQRYQAGYAHNDEDGAEIRAKNIAVIYTSSKVIDSYGRRETRTIGTGDAIVFQDGRAIEGLWKRSSLSQRTRFYDLEDQEVEFNAGTTWIEVVPDHFPKVIY